MINSVNQTLDKPMEVIDMVKNSLFSLFNQIAEFLPTLIGALITLFIFWLVARSLRWGLSKLLKAMNFDTLIEKTQVDEFLARGGMKGKISGILTKLVYWLVMLVGWMSFFNAMGLEVVSNLLTDLWAYLPRIFVSIILLLIGMWAANFVHTLVKTPLKANGFEAADSVAGIARFFVYFLVFSLVLNHLGIGTEIVNSLVSSFTNALGYGLAIAAGIAFGWGGRDWAAGIIEKYLK